MKWLFIVLAFLFLASCNPEEKTATPYFTVKGNPLFNNFNEPLDFKSLTAAHITEATDSIISHAKSEFEKIYAIDDSKRTFENTMRALDDIYNDLDRITSAIYLMANTHPDSLIRNTALDKASTLEKYFTDISLDEPLYNAVKSYAATEEAKSLDGFKKKFLKDELEDFERNGFALSKEKRDVLKLILDSITDTGTAFQNNIAAYQDFLVVNDEEIKGLPDDYKQSRKISEGKYKVDLTYPSFVPFMNYSTSDAARKKLYIKYNNRAAEKNLTVLKNLLQQRDEMSKLLGYKTYADWRMEGRMAKNPATAWAFEKNLSENVKPKADADYAELLTKQKRKTTPAEPGIQRWETAYISNILLKEKYELDPEEVKQYFSLDTVLAGLTNITQTIFGVKYKQIQDPSVWHPDVKAFEVYDGDKIIGRFYLDLFPRENKYTHAACFGMISGKKLPQGYQLPTASLVCNFPAPTAGHPSLLPHDDVETLFHEFGHVLHQMLTQAELASQAGTSVAQDFVEAPSQIFENWVWNYESLKLFAKHYETGEVLPEALYKKMIAAKNVGSGMATEAQILYGSLDMTLYNKFNPATENVTDLVKQLMPELTHLPYVENTHFEAAFGHLYGYGASYYGYLWSQVSAQDMFSEFEKNGVLDKATGMRYRNIILANGGSREPMDLVKEFLGREPNNEAFMRSLGL